MVRLYIAERLHELCLDLSQSVYLVQDVAGLLNREQLHKQALEFEAFRPLSRGAAGQTPIASLAEVLKSNGPH